MVAKSSEINAQQTQRHGTYQLPTLQAPAPEALPPGWVVRHSQSNPGYIYYFHQETGECQWEIPTTNTTQSVEDIAAAVANVFQQPSANSLNLGDVLPSAASSVTSSTTKKASNVASPPTKRQSSTGTTDQPSKKQRSNEEQVRVLHLLKKHKDSRKPRSWRNPNITITKFQAEQELQELISILKDVENDPKELRATFEELARTESDCSSSKRGGDLGFFGRRKMQPAFEKASFALKIGELSDVVDTSSGVHVILRLG